MCDIVIQGACGRMGRALAALIEARDDCRVVAGVDLAEGASLPASRMRQSFSCSMGRSSYFRMLLLDLMASVNSMIYTYAFIVFQGDKI